MVVVKYVDKKETGRHIRKLLKKKGMTASDLQVRLYMPSGTSVYAWLNGKYLPGIDNLLNIADILDCKVEDLLVIKEDVKW